MKCVLKQVKRPQSEENINIQNFSNATSFETNKAQIGQLIKVVPQKLNEYEYFEPIKK